MCLSAALRDPGFCPLQESGQSTATHQRNIGSSTSTHAFGQSPTTEKPPVESSPPVVSEPQELKQSPVRRDNQLEITSHLDVSLDISSSCKESEFRELSDAEIERPEVQPPEGKQEEPMAESESIDCQHLTSAVPNKTFETQAQRRSEEVEILIPAPPPPPDPKEPQLRFCTVCNIDQPLRAKHCNECRRCVVRYDHHCPWLSNCVGEKNHAVFLGYLYVQCVELALGICAVSYETAGGDDDLITALRATLIAVAGVLLALLGSLTITQTILVCNNLTTWEYKSWDKITYLKSLPRGLHKSPFSLGMRGNLSVFLQATWMRSPLDWKKAAMRLNSHSLAN